MNIIETMDFYQDSYSANEKRIYSLIRNQPNLVRDYTITQIAGFASVSTSAVLRFCKHLGFNGYKEFNYEIVNYLRSSQKKQQSDPTITLAKAYADAVTALPQYCKEQLPCLAGDILASKKVIALGRFRNKTIIDKLHMNLTIQGITCLTGSDLLSYEHYVKLVDPETTVIVFSVLHDTSLYKDTLAQIRNLTDRLWLVTCNKKNLHKLGFSHSLLLPAVHSSDYSTDSHAIMLIFVEMLSALLEQKQ